MSIRLLLILFLFPLSIYSNPFSMSDFCQQRISKTSTLCHQIRNTKGKDDPLYHYFSGRLSAFEEALYFSQYRFELIIDHKYIPEDQDE